MLNNILDAATRLGDKFGFGATLLAGAGCSVCFPALAGFGAAVGLGFLRPLEGALVSVVIPAIAVLLVVINVLGYFRHRQWHRSALGLVGPVLILIGAITMSELFFYAGLAAVFGVSIWDMLSSRHRKCAA
ncbi:MerC family mercury resistance protein [Spiribacter halobius]|uniref:Mercuric resistance protein MerC n=1 Tax=Sediminicurvatus halobius TaxID=2182432 RepID=A0A2U2N5Y3_9GAMM|nr:MerC family mercury resistance protein [Spiribacter halobius]PWG64520.1 Mercuric resistance protein MerC [Spiribacter halobius]UEX79160.1 MerC family mercury resistance protein [Spiribacter halobius]